MAYGVTSSASAASPGAQVIAWPRASGAGRVKSANTDQNGEFEIGELASVDYFVAAWENIPRGLADDPSFLNRFQSAEKSLSLEPSAHASVDVKLIPRETVDSEIEKLRQKRRSAAGRFLPALGLRVPSPKHRRQKAMRRYLIPIRRSGQPTAASRACGAVA